MKKRKIFHLNDRTLKYKTLAQSEGLHIYLDLPGEYEAMYPQEVILPNMDSGRVDDLHSTKNGLLINLEEESSDVGETTFKKYSKYAIFAEYLYSKNYYLAVLCHKDPKNYPVYFKRSPSVYIKAHYYYFTQRELWKKYDNVIYKVRHKKELSTKEALDIAFIPKFISKENASFVTESLSKAFKSAIINDEKLKLDVGVLLGAMILKHIDGEKQIELLEEIGMEQFENRIKIIAREEYAEELQKVEQENIDLKNENLNIKNENQNIKNENLNIKNKYNNIKTENNNLKTENNNIKTEFKKRMIELEKIPNLSPKAKKIINTPLFK